MKVSTENIEFGYSEEKVLHGIELNLDESGLICIIGPNGVGKSTLLKCLNRIIHPTLGKVLLNGYDLEDLSLKDTSEVVGYVPVESRSGFSMTVREAVMLGRHPHQRFGIATDSDLVIVHRVLRMTGLEKLADNRVDELSAGQKQRVAIARGIAQTPRVLLLDEPTANLDVCNQIHITRLLKELSTEENMIVIMVSHDLNIASRYADKVILMSPPGIVSGIGTPNDVITEDAIEHTYHVKCRIIDDCGRPHVILGDPIDSEICN